MRAISVRVNDVVGVAGFVLPGMRVDVLVTSRPANRAETETQTVLQNITVLSAGQTIQTDGKSQPIVAPVVTLLVTPAEAEALTLANVEGQIQLVLRNSTDQATVATRGRRLHEIQATTPSETAPPPKARRREPVPPPSDVIVAAPVSHPSPLPVAEPEQMVVIRGAVKNVEVFPHQQVTK
jgi:pilus assembly protein CpaB